MPSARRASVTSHASRPLVFSRSERPSRVLRSWGIESFKAGKAFVPASAARAKLLFTSAISPLALHPHHWCDRRRVAPAMGRCDVPSSRRLTLHSPSPTSFISDRTLDVLPVRGKFQPSSCLFDGRGLSIAGGESTATRRGHCRDHHRVLTAPTIRTRDRLLLS